MVLQEEGGWAAEAARSKETLGLLGTLMQKLSAKLADRKMVQTRVYEMYAFNSMG
jgi:hypothetical protein